MKSLEGRCHSDLSTGFREYYRFERFRLSRRAENRVESPAWRITPVGVRISALLFWTVGLAATALPAATPKLEKPPLNHAMLGVTNGCFVETVAFLDHWHETFGAESWARMLQWGAKEDEEVVAGHAVALGEARGALWAWDINFGWTKLPVDPAVRGDAVEVSKPILAKYPKVTARYPTLRHDFPQSPGKAPGKAEQPGAAERSVRDALLVGQKLARHRPVNVVRFSYGAGESKTESAAAVFVFHGRYCVYVPEIGTVPFRVKTSVENIRVIQELLRRAFPGVTGVRKL